MKIHEYQAKALFKEYGIAVPDGKPVRTVEETVSYLRETGRSPLVLKAQVHGGGRGKAGGIRIVGTPAEAEEAASKMLGRRLVTSQTGPEGRPVETLLVEQAIAVEREFYLGVAIDRPRNCAVVIASGDGGMEIEEKAARSPEKMLVERVHPGVGLRPFQAARIFYAFESCPGALQGHDLGNSWLVPSFP